MRMVKTALVLACGVIPGGLGNSVSAQEDECRFYTYKAQVTAVYDGDTITADIDLGFHVWLHGEKLRLYGIDAPEIRSRANHPVNAAEKARGLAARDALRELILGKEIELCTIKDKKGKYGRYLARIMIDGLDVNDWLISQGHAVPLVFKSDGIVQK